MFAFSRLSSNAWQLWLVCTSKKKAMERKGPAWTCLRLSHWSLLSGGVGGAIMAPPGPLEERFIGVETPSPAVFTASRDNSVALERSPPLQSFILGGGRISGWDIQLVPSFTAHFWTLTFYPNSHFPVRNPSRSLPGILILSCPATLSPHFLICCFLGYTSSINSLPSICHHPEICWNF